MRSLRARINKLRKGEKEEYGTLESKERAVI